MVKINPLRIYKRAYRLLDVPILADGEDCGLLCDRRCCTPRQDWGIYLMPGEEALIPNGLLGMKVAHRYRVYDLPPNIRYLYYVQCNGSCFNHCSWARRFRPIQCRTYPLAPYLHNGYLILYKNPIGVCPLSLGQLNPVFVRNCFKAWKLLMRLPQVRALIEYDHSLEKRHHRWSAR